MPVPHLRPTHNHPAYSLLNTLSEKGILEGLQKPSTFKSGTLVRKCRFYIGFYIGGTAKESEASPAGRRAGLTSETGCRSGTSETKQGLKWR